MRRLPAAPERLKANHIPFSDVPGYSQALRRVQGLGARQKERLLELFLPRANLTSGAAARYNGRGPR
ncbi:hypothetical protein [Streptomyces sp. TRM49041]|uniref:hypothetical protein n=1 Tax=Streptomyces sp. TRM49041 TaxID=2603216 RepID=UPI0011EBE475|nr:hypothetical protein [Streptomyces sp. TRM49041]